MNNNTKYIFVTGGVLSGLGKGITAASIGNILKARGFSVNIQKLDPYLNVDAGTLNPAEHGECFVTIDGAETDLDLGHYERFLDVELSMLSSVMSGRILRDLIQAERNGEFLGKTVQVVPHFTDAIQERVAAAANGYDIHIVEIGGTVGDYESPAFFEAIREFGTKVGRDNHINVQVVYLPYLGASKETKTKPAQNAVRDLRSLGIVPDVLVARSEEYPTGNAVKKLSDFGGVPERAIAILPNADTVYEVPLTLEETGIGSYIIERLGLEEKSPALEEWQAMVASANASYDKTVKVGLVAKYLDNDDTYICVVEALKSAAWKNKVNLELIWVDAEKMAEGDEAGLLEGVDGIVVPGGFGERGMEGKIKAARFAMDNDLPYLGLCLGMQMAVVALARKLGHDDANTVENNPTTSYPVVHIMEGQEELTGTGGTMRLGNYECVFDTTTKAYSLYGKVPSVMERHRHRYEFNNKYREELEAAGMVMAGVSPDNKLVELIEMRDHRFFMASQYHPEFNSRPQRAHPMFDGFIASL